MPSAFGTPSRFASASTLGGLALSISASRSPAGTLATRSMVFISADESPASAATPLRPRAAPRPRVCPRARLRRHRVEQLAAALEHYARQANNTEAERRACEIGLPAERKAPQLEEQQGAST